jgi:hypothetical protein
MSPREFREKLEKVEGFKEEIIIYLENLIKLDFDWAKEVDENEVHALQDFQHPGYQYPKYDQEGTSLEDWKANMNRDSKAIAVKTQLHRHHLTCYKKGKKCRFGFSGEGKTLVPETTVDVDTGKIELKRGHTRVNNHNPILAAVSRSNHDLKSIFTSGFESLSSMYYMTSYITKSEDDTSDLIALEESWRDLEKEGILRNPNEMERLRRLMIRINHTRSSGRQFSGAQVAAILLGIGNEGTHYASSTFNKLSLSTFVSFLENQTVDFKLQVQNDNIMVTDGTEQYSDDEEVMITDGTSSSTFIILIH